MGQVSNRIPQPQFKKNALFILINLLGLFYKGTRTTLAKE